MLVLEREPQNGLHLVFGFLAALSTGVVTLVPVRPS